LNLTSPKVQKTVLSSSDAINARVICRKTIFSRTYNYGICRILVTSVLKNKIKRQNQIFSMQMLQAVPE